MARGFLQSFDHRITVCSAGTEPAKQINRKAVIVMKQVGIDISRQKPRLIDQYLHDFWDYVITVCDHAKEACPLFPGKVKNRLHFGFEDPSNATGSEDFIMNEFRRIRDSIKDTFYEFYINELKPIL
jgi:arsenate reductase